ncbi:putative RNase H-like HicB family nuclease [Caballeronia udeis]|jgi:antitoxin HicB|uniref:RNase H-like HicB family nuclease n=1 Tax=Caballeronia udeis TaxID=1232866 RepID=A0ABW8MH77_9BURK
MFRYPARLKADEAGFTATFRDIPEAITAGETREEAIGMATDALATAMDFYFEDICQVSNLKSMTSHSSLNALSIR